MTDAEYVHFLSALARKHSRYPQLPNQRFFSMGLVGTTLDHYSGTSRLLKLPRDRDDPVLIERLVNDLQDSPVRNATELMSASGILDALDDVPDVVLGELRRSAIPREDEEYLRRAGFNDDDIEVLITIAVHRAHALAHCGKLPSDIAAEAAQALESALQNIQRPSPSPKPKRKLLDGIGKLLGGSVAAIGNVLLLAGTVIAPNPATAYGAIASGGVAVASFFAGLGDLKGE